MNKAQGLLERLKNGQHVLVAEGYLFELEQRGYLKAGAFVPEVVIEKPDAVRMLHEEFAHAGSDVVEAFTYYGHRTKMELIGRVDELEQFNRDALRIARKVADETCTLMAGNICNTTIYSPDNIENTRAIFKEQVEWAAEEGADFIIAETFGSLGEAKLALDCIKAYGRGMPAVVTMATINTTHTDEGLTFAEACRQLEEAGADVVGLNCSRGPDTILPIMKEVKAVCKGPLACLPVPYRTDESMLRMQNLKDKKTGQLSFPGNLNTWHCSRWEIEDFTKKAKDMGIQYLGLCCGNQAHYMRTMAETLGRSPPASKYSPDMTQHFSTMFDTTQVELARDQYNKELYGQTK